MKKQRTLAQKKKRPSSHRVGKRIDFSKDNLNKKNPFPPIDPFESSPSIVKKEGALKAGKKYKSLKKQVVVGYLMTFFAAIYVLFCIGFLIFRLIQLELHSFMDLSELVKEVGTLGLYKSQLHITDLAYTKTLESVVLNPVYLATAVFALMVGDTLKTNAKKEIEENKEIQKIIKSKKEFKKFQKELDNQYYVERQLYLFGFIPLGKKKNYGAIG